MKSSTRTTWNPLETYLLILVLLLPLGCSPRQVWHGQSPDHRRNVDLVVSGGQQSLVVNGSPGTKYDRIAIETVRFGSRGRPLAFAALEGARWVVTVDGRESAAYDAIGEVVITGPRDEVVFSAERAGKWFVVRGELESRGWDAIGAGTLEVGADNRLSYVAYAQGRAHAMLGSTLFGPFNAISQIARAPRSGRVALLAQDSRGCGVHREARPGVLDSAPAVFHEYCGGMLWSAGGSRLAYVGKSRDCTELVLDGAVREGCGVRKGSVSFGNGGRSVAYVRSGSERTCIVVDDRSYCGWDDADSPVLGDDTHWGAIGRRNGKSHVLLDGQTVTTASRADDLRLSRRGGHYAYVANLASGSRVVVDGKGTYYDLVVGETLELSADGRHWACLTGQVSDHELFLTVDGATQQSFEFEQLPALVLQYPREAQQQDLLRSWVRAELTLVTSFAP